MANRGLLAILILLSIFGYQSGSMARTTSQSPLSERQQNFYKIKIQADEMNHLLIITALTLMKTKTPRFFRLVNENIKEIVQTKGEFTRGPIKTIAGTARIEFENLYPRYSKYNIADFLVHEATHVVDIKNGRPLTKRAEIKAREVEIEFLHALERAERINLKSFIKFVKNEISAIKSGKLYSDLPD
jgi:hypothetical protein